MIILYAKSSIGSSPSPKIPRSLVPRMWLKSIGPPMLFGVLPGWTGVFKPLRLPPLYVDADVLCKHVASPTTRIPFSTANTGAAGILLCAAARRWRSQLSLMLQAGPGAVIGFGEVPTEYRPGCGISMVLKSLRKASRVKSGAWMFIIQNVSLTDLHIYKVLTILHNEVSTKKFESWSVGLRSLVASISAYRADTLCSISSQTQLPTFINVVVRL